jgi:hypothetical protein
MNKILSVAAVLSLLASPVLAQQYGTSAMNGQIAWNAQVAKATADAERAAHDPAVEASTAAIPGTSATDASHAPKANSWGDDTGRATAIAGFR